MSALLLRAPARLEAADAAAGARRGPAAGRPAGPAARPHALPRPRRPARARRPARRQHVGDAARRAPRPPRRRDGAVELHLSTPDPAPTRDRWVVELRRDGAPRPARRRDARAARRRHRDAARARISARAACGSPSSTCPSRSLRLPRAATARRSATPTSRARRPLEDHQTIFATEPGSAEMPSAGRPFTTRALTRCARAGSASRRSCCTPASARWSAASGPTPSASASPRTRRERVNAARAPGTA